MLIVSTNWLSCASGTSARAVLVIATSRSARGRASLLELANGIEQRRQFVAQRALERPVHVQPFEASFGAVGDGRHLPHEKPMGGLDQLVHPTLVEHQRRIELRVDPAAFDHPLERRGHPLVVVPPDLAKRTRDDLVLHRPDPQVAQFFGAQHLHFVLDRRHGEPDRQLCFTDGESRHRQLGQHCVSPVGIEDLERRRVGDRMAPSQIAQQPADDIAQLGHRTPTAWLR